MSMATVQTPRPSRVSSVRMCVLAEISYRQLDYWCRTGVLCPRGQGRGSGTQRTFAVEEVRVVVFVAALRDHGAPTGVLAVAAEQMREWDDWTGDVVVARDGHVARMDAFGRACWIVNLDLCVPEAA